MPESKPKIALITTGGTIASLGKDPLDVIDYNSGMHDVDALVERVPEINRFADIVRVRFAEIGSHAIDPNTWRQLNDRIRETLKQDPDLQGLVITHGTATLEETAYFLHLTVDTDLPVVIVGAQRPITGLSSDGPFNLVNAVRVAASPACRGLGVVVVMNDEIHSARDVAKRAVFRLNAFQTPDFGVLGHTDLDRIDIYRRPTRLHTRQSEFSQTPIGKLPRVDIVASYAGCDGVAIESFVGAGAKGIVIATHPPGVQTPAQTDPIRTALQSGVTIVYATHAGSGRTLALPSQQVPGCVMGDNLTAQKARILLMLALTRTGHTGKIQDMFNRY